MTDGPGLALGPVIDSGIEPDFVSVGLDDDHTPPGTPNEPIIVLGDPGRFESETLQHTKTSNHLFFQFCRSNAWILFRST